MRYFMVLSYKGTAYNGWQIQTKQKHVVSVQGVLENKLTCVLGHPVRLIASGRTDTGVHARQQVAHFDTPSELNDTQLISRLNRFLPSDIAIHDLFLVQPRAHARFDAQARHYLYQISTSKNPFEADTSWTFNRPLDLDYLNTLAAKLKMGNCFRQFTTAKTDLHNFNCTIQESKWTKKNGIYQFYIIANRFLRSMVRILVGQMVKTNLGQATQTLFEKQIFEPNLQTTLKFKAPAKGLSLAQVVYPDHIKT